MSLPCPSSVLDAECIGVREAQSWLMSYQNHNVVIETDSLLTIRVLTSHITNL